MPSSSLVFSGLQSVFYKLSTVAEIFSPFPTKATVLGNLKAKDNYCAAHVYNTHNGYRYKNIYMTILGQERCLRHLWVPQDKGCDLSGSSWSMCFFYRGSHNGTSCEAGLGEVQPTRSTSFPAWKSCVSSLILVIRPRSWVSHQQPHLKPCSGAMMMLSDCMMLLMTICENLALVADDTCERNWSEPFWMVAFLKTGVISVVLQSSGTVLLLNAELMIKVILIAGTVLSYSWSCQQLLVWNNKTITNNMRNIVQKKSYPQT